jgi:hypothetical protein
MERETEMREMELDRKTDEREDKRMKMMLMEIGE